MPKRSEPNKKTEVLAKEQKMRSTFEITLVLL